MLVGCFAWEAAAGGAVPPPFWVALALGDLTALAALLASAWERSWRLGLAGGALVVAAARGTQIAVVYWALHDFTF